MGSRGSATCDEPAEVGMNTERQSTAALRLVLFFTVLLAAGTLSAQENLDSYYAFPLSFGANYSPQSPIVGVDISSRVQEITGNVRLPIPGLYFLQPFVSGGVRSVDVEQPDVPTVIGGILDDGVSLPDYEPRDVWDHTQFFGAIGLGVSHRVSKEFELGLDASVGFGESVYNRRLVTAQGTWSPVAALGLVFGLDGKIALNPSFNFSVDVRPSIRYDLGIGPLKDFNGLYFGVGFAASYRAGRDPDAPLPDIRAIDFGDLTMPPVFAAMQSVYVTEPIAQVEITNTESADLEDVHVLFNQQQFMDSPTASADVAVIAPGETVTVPIHASFNSQVFRTNGITPANGEVIAQYTYLNRPLEQRLSVSFDLHDRNALTWDDNRKVAAFITYSDSAIRNYSSFIRSAARNENTDYFPDALEFGMQAFHALASLGILYQPDPSAPFTTVQEDTFIVDSVNLPRETLRSITGDCDDLTVLYDTMLETVGIPTGFVTTPGHIYSAIDMEVEPDDYSLVHPDPAMTIEHDGTLWILVEITLVGQSNFIDAWHTGMAEWRSTPEEQRTFDTTAESQSIFRPVGLIESDLGLQYGDPEDFIVPYRQDLERLSSGIISPLLDRAQSRNQPRAWNHLGVVAGRLGQFAVAEDAFNRSANLDPQYVNPLANQGSLEFMQGNYDEAITAYDRARLLLESLPDQTSPQIAASIYLNLSRALYAENRFAEAEEYVKRVQQLDSGQAAGFGYISAREAGGARASNSAAEPISFVDDDE